MKAVLLVNIGSPDSPEPVAVRRYLKQFLLDPRVLDLGRLMTNLLVRGLIIPFRTRQSAKNYEEIWTKEGSPLVVHTKMLADLVQKELGAEYTVRACFRYGSPSFDSCLKELEHFGAEEITIFPLFPQYASATTGSVLESALSKIATWKYIPAIRTVSSFWHHPLFLETWAALASSYVLSDYDHIIFSYHGLPERQVRSAPSSAVCYRSQCHQTTERLVGKLGLDESRYTISFQSRLGREKWLEPYTTDVLMSRAQRGDKRILLFSPSFAADCLETLHELEIEAKAEFLAHGGHVLDCVPCPNSHPHWVQTLCSIIKNS